MPNSAQLMVTAPFLRASQKPFDPLRRHQKLIGVDHMTSNNIVLITGASAGLGAEFARAFAKRGDNVILVARRADRLEALATQLSADHGITATTISTDLTEAGAVARLMVEIADNGLTITHLVNNAGYGLRGAFGDLDGPKIGRASCRERV